jgi:hypothetical protein
MLRIVGDERNSPSWVLRSRDSGTRKEALTGGCRAQIRLICVPHRRCHHAERAEQIGGSRSG